MHSFTKLRTSKTGLGERYLSKCLGRSLWIVKKIVASAKVNEENLQFDGAGPSKKQFVRGGCPEIKLDDFNLYIIRQSIPVHDFYFNKVFLKIAIQYQKLMDCVLISY